MGVSIKKTVKKMTILNKLFFITPAVFLTVSLSCMDAVLVSNGRTAPLEIHNLSARLVNGKAQLTWDAPAIRPSFYRIYRTTKIDSLGNPVVSTWKSFDAQSVVDSMATFFEDFPGVENDKYFYTIQGINVVINSDMQTDTVRGPLSKVAACIIGNAIRFYLYDSNLGSEYYTSGTGITAILSDPRLEVDSVRFTQSELIDTGTGLFNANDYSLPDSPIDDKRQIEALRKVGYITSKQSVILNRVPLFNGASHKVGLSLTNHYPLTLSKGFGKKNAYAQVFFKSGVIDTIVALIQTKPPKIQLDLRTPPDAMKDTLVEGSAKRIAILYGDELLFGVNVFAGEYIDTEFEAWILFRKEHSSLVGEGDNPFDSKTTPAESEWIMTKPITYSLTAKGDMHNSDTVYSFPLSLKKDSRYFVFDNILRGKGLKLIQNIVANGSEVVRNANHALFDSLQVSELMANGRKEFFFVTRFHDTQFQDDIIRVLGVNEDMDSLVIARDVYLPQIKQQAAAKLNPYHIAEKQIISDVFSYALDSISITDKGGYAPTVAVSLIMALKPQSMVFDTVRRRKVTLPMLEQLPHYEKSFNVQQFGNVVKRVVFENIDPRLWTSGEYIFAVKVRDSYGNVGIANMADKVDKNPFLVTVKTSY
jgi:hypothetical protein